MARYLCVVLMVTNLAVCSEYCVKNAEIVTEFHINQGADDYPLDLKGDSSIMVIAVPTVPGESTYFIELFKNGMIRTTRGEGTDDIYYEDFTGDKECVFENIVETKQRLLKEEEIKKINAINSRLDLNKINKKYLERVFEHDVAGRIVWINRKAYYYYCLKGEVSGADLIPVPYTPFDRHIERVV